MNNLPPQYNFLLAAFTANPDYFMDSLFRQDTNCITNPYPINVFFSFNDSIKEIARNDVTMRLLPKLNDEVIMAWEKSANQKWKSISKDKTTSPFEFLKRAVEDIMMLHEETPYFKINTTGIWNNLTFEIGEDLFATVLFADRYTKHGIEPTHFQWNYILHSNFFDLNHLLKKEKINENHYHLGGSSPNADLSWLYLMNNPENQEEKFANFEENFALEQKSINTLAAFHQTRLYDLIKIAAYIRVRLFEKCCLSNTSNEWRIGKILEEIDLIRKLGVIINDAPYDMQSNINYYRTESYHHFEDSAIDYAILNFQKKENLNYIEIAGERHLYYCCLKQIFHYKEEESIELQKLFYLYLLIKNKFCGIFIQRNSKYGFDNFHKYQSTKSDIIKGSIYEKLAKKMAVKYNIRENYIDKLELRITTKQKEKLLRADIKYYDKYAEEDYDKHSQKYYEKFLKIDTQKKSETEKSNSHFYVISFGKPKNSDWGIENDGDFKMNFVCRESKLREKIKKEAFAINELRQNARKISFRIYGIDAASHEINCRPEVFGQVFRYLSNSNLGYPFLHYDPNKIELPHLKKSYHVGEDFYDIIDGLRSIDEAILFLQLKHGDRIGHAVALGLNSEKYYKDRPHIAMPKQNALDNYAWILYCIEKLGVNVSQSFYAHLISQFDKYFNDLYNSSLSLINTTPPDLQAYIQSWKLRGDEPECYSKKLGDNDDIGSITRVYLNPVTEWNFYDFCYRENYNNIKSSVYNLYHRYHFDNGLKKAAKEIVEIKVTDEYVALATQLQKVMCNFVLKKGVAIESNPSSNFLISNLDKIIELPLFKLFPIEESENDVRLNVSVNTDDQGVFYTSLVKEYTLLAGALQNECNEQNKELRKYSNDKILTWIERLVDNSKSQCFMRDRVDS